MFEPILLKRASLPRSESIDVYLANGGYRALEKALREYRPDGLIELIRDSKLRGRGGAGFPAGLKWGFMPKEDVQKYLCVNTDEGEPGTFKDRVLVEKDPHQVIEGATIAAYAVGATRAFVYIRGEFFLGVKRWVKAIADAYAHGYLGENILDSGFDLDMTVHRGAGAYICGEETAMIESLEGRRGEPRLKPPYPAQVGYLGQPTLVHNVETLANVPHIVLNGADWYAAIGTQNSTGPKIFCVSGCVYRRGVYELPLGTPLSTIIYDYAGGVPGDKRIKAIIPGGASTPFLTADQIDVPMDFESLAAAGSALGTGAIVVLDQDTCMVDVARRTARFFAHESCGRCTPCRVGSQRILAILEGIEVGRGQPGDIERLQSLCDGIQGHTFCPLGDALVAPIRSSLAHFADEYWDHIERRACPFLLEEAPLIRAAYPVGGTARETKEDLAVTARKILVVDDDPDFVEVTRIVLESAGYEVISSADGGEGLSKVRQEKPDLVILDVIMRTVLDGLHVSQEMAKDPEQCTIPILMVTSIANRDYATLFLTDDQVRFDDFACKPIAPDDLLRRVKALI